MTVAAFAPDLMDRSRIATAVPQAAFLATVDELATTGAALVLVDLSRPGVVEQLGSVTGRVVGFGAHVEADLLAAAEAAGCDLVLARSAFFRRLPELVAAEG